MIHSEIKTYSRNQDNRWYANCFVTIDGERKRVTKQAKSEIQAIRLLEDHLATLAGDAPTPSSSSKINDPTVEQFARQFLDSKLSIKPSTLAGYEYGLSKI